MNSDMEFLSVIPYTQNFLIQNVNVSDIPFVLDGDVTGSRINDIVPQLGVVPAIADFLLSCIKDDRSTGQMANVYTNWTNGIIGVAPKPEKYASFGTYSIRYPYKEVLKSFSYKFAYEIYNDILHPTGENFNKGQTEADRILTETTFTQMLSDFDAVKLSPEKDWKAMKSQIRVGKRGDAPSPPLSPLVEAVKYGSKFVFFKTPDATVIQDAEQYSGNVKTQFENWLKKQQPKISTAFLTDIEDELSAIFTKMEDGNRVPKTLQDDPSSIVVARDLLKHLKDKFIDFEKYLADKFNAYFYPEGQGRPDIIARQQEVVGEKRRIMEDDSGDVAETQEAYLKEASKLLEYEVWELLFKGIQAITTELKQGVLRLWNLIGDDANGWVNRLTEFLDQIDDEYDDDITRRNNLAEFRLRDYLPTPDGLAEDALFDKIAEPEIQSLMAQMHWDFAINPEDPQRRYTILIRSPQVDGFDYGGTTRFIDPQTGRPIDAYQYTPYEHVFDARNKLATLLENQTIWDMMEFDFEHEWLPKRVEEIDDTQRSEYEDQYVREWVNKLITGSSPLLNSTQPAHTTEAFTFSHFQQATHPTDIATKFSATLRPRLLQNETMSSDPSFSKEIRRCIAYLQVPIASWNYYSDALENYIIYNQRPQRVLIDVYPNEQNAFYLRQLIVDTIVHNFTGLLDVSVTAILNNLEVFKYFALDYVIDLIPKKPGATRVAPKIFYVNLQAGSVDLAEAWDIDELCLKINRMGMNQNDPVLKVQSAIRKLWQDRENEEANANTLPDFLDEVEQRSQALTFPNLPTGQTAKVNRGHLKLAFQAIIKDYVSRLRAR